MSREKAWYPVETYDFVFTIDNFNRSYKDSKSIRSSKFPLATNKEHPIWSLKMYPAGIDAASKNYISLYLRLITTSKRIIKADFQFQLINANNKKEITMKYRQPQNFMIGDERGFRRFFALNELRKRSHQLLPNGALTISAQITTFDQDGFKIEGLSQALLNMDLPKYFAQLFESQKLTDTIFCIKGVEIKAHKAILAARSEVFQAMFETEMQEKITNRVQIIDIEYDVFKAMLNFIYKDEAPKSNMAMELLVAADKYALHRLKGLCERKIYMNVNKDNAAEVLYFADLHSCAYLKTHTLDIIVLFSDTIKDTVGWRSLEKKHPNLIDEANEEIRTRKIK